MKSDKRTVATPVGSTFLLTIFSVLCLLVFTILTISTAVAEKKLSEKAADSVSAYYAADLEAEKIFSTLRAGTVPANVTVDGNTYSYSVEISPSLVLQVTLLQSENEWSVLQWETVSFNQ